MILAVLSIIGGWLAAPAMLGAGPDYFTKFLQPVFGGPKQSVLKGRCAHWNSRWRYRGDQRADRRHGGVLALSEGVGQGRQPRKSMWAHTPRS